MANKMTSTPTTPTKRIPIAEIRHAIWAATHSRNNHCNGGTHDEFIRCNVPVILERHLTKLTEILPLIPKRYEKEKEDCFKGLERCKDLIAHWTLQQTPDSITYRDRIQGTTQYAESASTCVKPTLTLCSTKH
jgi:GT2 family glycosyltransferase